MSNILIRTDGRPEIGLGHIIRMISFAQELKKYNHNVIFILKNSSDKIKNLIKTNSFDYKTLNSNLSFKNEPDKIMELLKTYNSDFLIIDSYEISEKYIQTIKQKSKTKILFMDDFCHHNFYCADFVVNVNYGSKKLTYNKANYTKIFAGEKYFFIRDIFKQERKNKLFQDTPKYILALLGGTDFLGLNSLVCNIFNKIQKEFDIKTGIMTINNDDNLKNLCKKNNIELYINPENPAKIIAKADIGIINGGLTKYDFAYLGIPAITIPLIEHQQEILKDFEKTGAIINLDLLNNKKIDPDKIYDTLVSLIKDSAKRKQMHENALKLIDEEGAERIVKLLN